MRALVFLFKSVFITSLYIGDVFYSSLMLFVFFFILFLLLFLLPSTLTEMQKKKIVFLLSFFLIACFKSTLAIFAFVDNLVHRIFTLYFKRTMELKE